MDCCPGLNLLWFSSWFKLGIGHVFAHVSPLALRECRKGCNYNSEAPLGGKNIFESFELKHEAARRNQNHRPHDSARQRASAARPPQVTKPLAAAAARRLARPASFKKMT